MKATRSRGSWGWRREGMVLGVVLLMVACVGEGKVNKPVLPKSYGGNGNTLVSLVNSSWPSSQGANSIYTFFAPSNSAIKKYPCLFTQASQTVATSVLQYHIIPGKALTSTQLKTNAATVDYMLITAYNGKRLNVTKGGKMLNGYSNINQPDIGTKTTQTIHGINTLLVPPGLSKVTGKGRILQIGCGPAAPRVKGSGNKTSNADRPLSLQLARTRYVDAGIATLSLMTMALFF